MQLFLRSFIQVLVILLISCNDGRFISPGIRSNMYLKENARPYNLLSYQYNVKTVRLNAENIEQIKLDLNNYTDQKVTKSEIEKLYGIDLGSKIGFLIMIVKSKGNTEDKQLLVNLVIDTKINECEPIEKIKYPYNFVVFDRLGAGPYQPQVFSYPKYPVEAYAWQYEPTASNVDIWTKETLRALVLFSDKCVSKDRTSLQIELSDKSKNRVAYSFSY
ncbi:hypothetical protein [Leptospira stimsonii]|uniref:Lipoprotein n=1 Tax=Leptospira stimsonii TaxID=2202203 RepID=A0ABY2N394_9LEPT|nr:hypothetical protein [Leptospira stimsonii]TGK26936.1 hypothetical protein EHO98_00055 [Leptospira stimsonii]TGM14889.1 hypothetical protein EHQ90_10425 [Leptospira stimsonii]